MKTKLMITAGLFTFALAGVANAQTGSGTLGVTANIAGSISLSFLTDAS